MWVADAIGKVLGTVSIWSPAGCVYIGAGAGQEFARVCMCILSRELRFYHAMTAGSKGLAWHAKPVKGRQARRSVKAEARDSHLRGLGEARSADLALCDDPLATPSPSARSSKNALAGQACLPRRSEPQRVPRAASAPRASSSACAPSCSGATASWRPWRRPACWASTYDAATCSSSPMQGWRACLRTWAVSAPAPLGRRACKHGAGEAALANGFKPPSAQRLPSSAPLTASAPPGPRRLHC